VLGVPRILALSALVLGCVPATASASLKIGTSTSAETLAVAPDGSAQVTWHEGGATRAAVIRGSRVTYSAQAAAGTTGSKITPDVAYGVAEVVLPNGTHYALQRVRRLGQFGKLGPSELHFARWRGDQPELSLTGEWAYNGRLPRICGTATYHGRPFFGFKHSATGNPLDELGRNVYIDALLAGGWYRIEGVLTRPKGFALLIRDSAWRGSRYRALVSGPNIGGDLAPDVTATTPLPAEGTTGACPFATGVYAGS
jgi:hypothetical protein